MRLLIALLYAGCTGFAAIGSLGMLTAPPMAFGGPALSPPLIDIPREWLNVLFAMCFIVFCPVGGWIGWRIARYVDKLALKHPNVAAMMMFFILFVPAFCGLSFFTLFWLQNDGQGKAFTPLVEYTAFCAFISMIYRLAIGNRHGHGDQTRGSSSDVVHTRSTKNDQP